ncbi:MAG: hypothetical protein ACFNQF_09095, partial [Bacteroides sp.]
MTEIEKQENINASFVTSISEGRLLMQRYESDGDIGALQKATSFLLDLAARESRPQFTRLVESVSETQHRLYAN